MAAGAWSLRAAGWEGFRWDQGEGHVALLGADDHVVWRFNHSPDEGVPYFHPVAAPNGPPLTWHAPEDHPWHYGLWFSWKYVNGVNYWEYDRGTRRHAGQTTWRNVQVVTRDDASARVEMNLEYRPTGTVDAVLIEHRVVEVSAPGPDGRLVMKWMMTFRAGDKPVRLDRTPHAHEPGGKPWGGYAGLTWRFAEAFGDWKVINLEGERDLACHGKGAAAIDFSGSIEGTECGVAMIDHPENPRAPTPWYVAMQEPVPFACVLPAPLWSGGYDLAAGEELVLRYRVIIHPGRWSPQELGAEAGTW